MDNASEPDIHAQRKHGAGGAPPVAIRPMTGDDLEQVISIDRMSFTMPWPPSSYRFELYENPSSRLWVAEAHHADGKKEVVGMVVVWLIMDEAHIATFAVHPGFRNRGIGRKLLVQALRESRQMGATSATLEVRSSNLTAQRLYKDLGFEVVSTRSRYYVDNNEDALIMTVRGLDDDYISWIEDL